MTQLEKAMKRITKTDVIDFLVEDQAVAIKAEIEQLDAKLRAYDDWAAGGAGNAPPPQEMLRKDIEDFARKTLRKKADKVQTVVNALAGGELPNLTIRVVPSALGLTSPDRLKGRHWNREDTSAYRPRNHLVVSTDAHFAGAVEVSVSGFGPRSDENRATTSVNLAVQLPLTPKLKGERLKVIQTFAEWDKLWVQRHRLREALKSPAKIKAEIKSRLAVAVLQGTPDGMKLLESMKSLGLVNGELTKAITEQVKNPECLVKQIETGAPIPAAHDPDDDKSHGGVTADDIQY